MLDIADVATPPATPVPVAAEPLAEAPVRWSLATRLAFRFGFLYFGLYVLTGATGWMLRPVRWTATYVFHVTSQYSLVNTGSGDKTIDWVHAFILLVFSIAATAIWSAVD